MHVVRHLGKDRRTSTCSTHNQTTKEKSVEMSNAGLMADISNNNDSVNINAYAKAGFRAIGIKASEGVSFFDPDHRGWCYAAGGKHLSIFHYHFARPDSGNSPEAEAAHFLAAQPGPSAGA